MKKFTYAICFASAVFAAGPLAQPGKVQGTALLNSSNSALMHSLNLEKLSHGIIRAESTGLDEALGFTTLAEPSGTNKLTYELDVEASDNGITYKVTADAYYDNGNKVFRFPTVTSNPVFPDVALNQNLAQCVSLLDIRFLDQNKPKIMSGGRVEALKETSPGSNNFWEQATLNVIPYGATQQYLPIIGDGSLYNIDVYWQTGTDGSNDLITQRCRQQVASQCNQIIQVNCQISQNPVFGNITGLLDIEGSTVLNVQELAQVTAWKGPLNNQRFHHLSGSSQYFLSNLVPSSAESPEKPYQLFGDLFSQHGESFQYTKTPELGLSNNPGVIVEANKTQDMGNTFVLNAGYVNGSIHLKAPLLVSGTSSLHYLVFDQHIDNNGDALPDDIYLNKTHVAAKGSVSVANGAKFSAAGGFAKTTLNGETTNGEFNGSYQLALGGLNGESSIWVPNQIALSLENNSNQDYLSSQLTITDNTIGNTLIIPGESTQVDQTYCLGEVTLTLYSDQVFHQPTLTGSGQYAASDFWGNNANYHVKVASARGLPLTNQNTNQGTVRLALPAGQYQLTPSVLVPGGAGTQVVDLEEITVNVACQERKQISNRLVIDLDNLPTSTADDTITITGQVSGNGDITNISYEVNGGGQQTLCDNCGANPGFQQDLQLEEGSNSIVVYVTNDQGETSQTEVVIEYKPVTPPPPPPAPLRLKACQDASFEAQSGSGGMIAYHSVETLGGCGTPSLSCSHESGSFFATGSKQVQCYAYDSCGQTNDCQFTITITEPEEPACEGDAAKPLLSQSARLSSIWPPNLKWVNIGLSIEAQDPCDAENAPLITTEFWSDEPERRFKGIAANLFAKDVMQKGDTTYLRAERNVFKDGRVYLIITKAKGINGDTSTQCSTVTISKSHRQKSKDSVANQAESAKALCAANGMAPASYHKLSIETKRSSHHSANLLKRYLGK